MVALAHILFSPVIFFYLSENKCIRNLTNEKGGNRTNNDIHSLTNYLFIGSLHIRHSVRGT